MRKPCPRHPDVPRYPSGGCPVCTDLRQRKRRAAARRARGPKKLSPREKARRAGRQFYRPATACPRGHRCLRYVKNCRCVECNRSYFPARLSKAAKEHKRLYQRDHARRRARALRVLNALVGGHQRLTEGRLKMALAVVSTSQSRHRRSPDVGALVADLRRQHGKRASAALYDLLLEDEARGARGRGLRGREARRSRPGGASCHRRRQGASIERKRRCRSRSWSAALRRPYSTWRLVARN